MTTVGYGDTVPRSSLGSIVVGVLIITSVLYTAIPLGMVGKTFTDIWVDRHRILLLRKLYDCLQRSGHTAMDMPALFQRFDTDGSGELDLEEFKHMMEEISMGLRDDQVVTLFEAFETEGADTINARSLVRTLYPSAYHSMFGSKASRQPSTLAISAASILSSNVGRISRFANAHPRSSDSTGD